VRCERLLVTKIATCGGKKFLIEAGFAAGSKWDQSLMPRLDQVGTVLDQFSTDFRQRR
jgi:hypothetical protein